MPGCVEELCPRKSSYRKFWLCLPCHTEPELVQFGMLKWFLASKERKPSKRLSSGLFLKVRTEASARPVHQSTATLRCGMQGLQEECGRPSGSLCRTEDGRTSLGTSRPQAPADWRKRSSRVYGPPPRCCSPPEVRVSWLHSSSVARCGIWQ